MTGPFLKMKHSVLISFELFIIRQVHVKPLPVKMPTDVNEYHNIGDLPDQWRYAINDKGQVYYYHTKILISQWEKPVKFLPLMEEQRINEIDIKVEPHGKYHVRLTHLK